MSELSGSEPKPGNITCYPVLRTERLFGEAGYGMDLFRLVGEKVVEDVKVTFLKDDISEEQGEGFIAPMNRDLMQFYALCLLPNSDPPIDFLIKPHIEFRQSDKSELLRIAVDMTRGRVATITQYEVAIKDEMRQTFPNHIVEELPRIGVRATSLRERLSEPSEVSPSDTQGIVYNLIHSLRDYVGLAKHGYFKLRNLPMDL